jgi:cytidylate kinase
MPAKRISQRDARGYRKRVAELESRESDRRQRWSSTWPGGCVIASIDIGTWGVSALSAVKTARALQHPVVATVDGDVIKLWGVA